MAGLTWQQVFALVSRVRALPRANAAITQRVRQALRWTAGAFALCLVAAGLATYLVSYNARDRIYDSVDEIPFRRVGLLLGTSPKIANGQVNLYYRYRMEAAASLWHNKKVEVLLVSGDNRRDSYNEPREMVRSLVALGVDPKAIASDYAGIRTLDSVVRAKEVFGLRDVTIISQQFHDERAIYLADAIDLDAIALRAGDVDGPNSWPVQVREVLARGKMMFDLLTGVGPRHLGPRVELPSP